MAPTNHALSRRELFETLLAAAAAGAVTRAQTPGLQLSPLGKNLSLLSGDGGNIAFLTSPDGLLMVDSGLPDQAPALMDKAKAAAPKIAILINTHWHFDHTGGNVAIGKSGAKLLAHANVMKRLATKQTIAFMHRDFEPLASEGLPAEILEDKGTLTYAGEKLKYNWLPPAHTDGDTIVHFEHANVLHCGDLYFNGSYPFIDYSTGGNIEGMISNAARLIKIADDKTQIIPGHGPLSNKKELIVYHEVISGANEAVSKQIKEGKPLDQIVAAKPLAQWDAKWGNGMMKPDFFITMLYQGKKA